jgi:hypothetical protein
MQHDAFLTAYNSKYPIPGKSIGNGGELKNEDSSNPYNLKNSPLYWQLRVKLADNAAAGNKK